MSNIIEIKEGTTLKIKLRRTTDSFVITLPRAVVDYLEAKEGDALVLVMENSKKWGHYCGVGKLKITDAVEAEEEASG